MTAARAGSGSGGARIGVGARVVAEVVVKAVLAGLRSLQPVWRGHRMLRQSSSIVRRSSTFAARQAHYPYPANNLRSACCGLPLLSWSPPLLWQASTRRCRVPQLLPYPPQLHCPGALPVFASSLAAPLLRHIPPDGHPTCHSAGRYAVGFGALGNPPRRRGYYLAKSRLLWSRSRRRRLLAVLATLFYLCQ